jgi:NAD+ kinase
MQFKTIGLLGRDADNKVAAMLAELGARLRALGLDVLPAPEATPLSVRTEADRIETELARARPDLVIVVGGDGTMLAAAHLLAPHDIPLLGVNVGRLGFLADIALDAMHEEIAAVLAGRFTEERRFMLHGAIEGSGEGNARGDGNARYAGIALNDVVVQKAESGRMIEFETRVDGSFVGTHRADGVIIATPTGSTAYALSGGGPILHPALDAMVIVPICPHTLSDRPIVVQGGSTVEVVLTHGYSEPAGQVSWDSQQWQALDRGERVGIRRDVHAVRLLHPLDHDYYTTLRTKLRWGHGREESGER